MESFNFQRLDNTRREQRVDIGYLFQPPPPTPIISYSLQAAVVMHYTSGALSQTLLKANRVQHCCFNVVHMWCINSAHNWVPTTAHP